MGGRDIEMGYGKKVGPSREWFGKRGTYGGPVLCHQNAAEVKNERVQ